MYFYKKPNSIKSEYNPSKRPSGLIDAAIRAGDCRFASYHGHVCSAATQLIAKKKKKPSKRPSGLMGKASDSGVRGCGFESYMGHV